MKKSLTLILLFFAVIITVQAQSLDERATLLTQELAGKAKLNEGEFVKVKAYTMERLVKIDELATLREQDERYLDLRLDQIEEEYNSRLFNTLSPKQYTAFLKYKEKQPYSYAAIVKKTPYIAAAKDE